MINMMAEAMVALAWTNLAGGESLNCDILLFPEGKRRPGQPFNEMAVSISIPSGPCKSRDLKVVATHKKHNGQVMMRYEESFLDQPAARHFLRGLLASVKPFDFKTHEPFYTFTTNTDSTKTV